MKAFHKAFAAVFIMIALIFIVTNIALHNAKTSANGRPYRVEINRIALEIEENGFESVDLSEYDYVTKIEKYSDNFYDTDSDYVVHEIGGELYRFDYTASAEKNHSAAVIVNITLAVMSVIVFSVMIYIKTKILTPFEKLASVPYELSKGNLTVPVKENKNKFFGRFIWGVDMLRENMEQQKKREIEMQKDKKTLLLSLSHDIKTPLSAIKLYSRALSKGLYANKEKQLEIAENINAKADEIETYVSKIITASRQDFLSLDVNMGEFYLSELVSKISVYYTEKLSLIKTDFTIGKFTDCLVNGDIDRSVEVIQNIMENAVKYGDGRNISIRFGEEENCILVSVKNSGNTLKEDELPHIFESFWRGSNSEQHGGSGLGLYICRQLMHKMDGEVFAEVKNGFMCVTAVFGKA